MAKPRPVPTVRARRLAAELRRMREQAGLTQETVVERTGKDRSTLYRLESGQQRPQRGTLIQLLSLYGADEQQRVVLLDLLREARQRGWMHHHDADLPAVYSDFIGFEAEATSITDYESLFVPGLLQTEDYATAVIRGTLPHASRAEVDTRVTARMERQALLVAESPPRLWAIADEATIRRSVGGLNVMRAQLRHLTEAAELPNVTVQVIPFGAGAHPGMTGSFITLEFPDPADPGLVYIESMAGDLFLEDDAELRRYRLMFEHLRAAALRPGETTALLAAIAAE